MDGEEGSKGENSKYAYFGRGVQRERRWGRGRVLCIKDGRGGSSLGRLSKIPSEKSIAPS